MKDNYPVRALLKVHVASEANLKSRKILPRTWRQFLVWGLRPDEDAMETANRLLLVL